MLWRNQVVQPLEPRGRRDEAAPTLDRHVLGSGVDQVAGGSEAPRPAPAHQAETTRAGWAFKENGDALGWADVVGWLLIRLRHDDGFWLRF